MPSRYQEHAALAGDFPLDFTLQYPPRREYFQDFFRQTVRDAAVAEEVATDGQMLLYVHVPFCQAKCYFCNFAVDIRTAPELYQRYADLLCEQIKRLDELIPQNVTVPGIDIGGGTPTMLNEDLLSQVLAALTPWRERAARAGQAHPLSIETTPRIAAGHPERLAALRAGGVSRISMGVQSVNAATLASVNRTAQENMTEAAIANMRAAGFRRVNVDVIFGLPQQTAADWRANVQAVIDMDIDSVTTYDCLYRGKGRALTKRTRDKPTADVYGDLYDMSYDMLTAAGFHAPYGSVNFSRIKGETGTSPYFEGRLFDHVPYIGTGNYASSMVGDYWWFAPHGVNDWMKRIDAGDVMPAGDSYMLPPLEMMAKQVLLSLNFGTVSAARFENRFGMALEKIYGDALAYGLAQGWLVKTEDGYGVAAGHFRHMPQIRALFYTPEAVGWLRDGVAALHVATA
jgi:oxygen-independent coproporphyrinogen-3 oxidase